MSDIVEFSQQESKILPDIHIDERFLQDHLRDSRSEMSWRRELEFRLMQFMLVFYPVIGTVMVALFQSDINVWAFAATAAGVIVFVLAATVVVTKRIDHEHKVYVELSDQVLLVWKYFGLFKHGAYFKDQAFLEEKLLDKKTGLGRGRGYKKTQGLIWITSFTVMTLLVILAVIKILLSLK